MTTFPSPIFENATINTALTYTATGGTVARTAETRAADVANVLDFGADPTGAADSTTAFQSALATGKSVWAPTGTYHITSQITVGNAGIAQTLFGDGLATTITIDDTFSVSVTDGVFKLVGREQFAPTMRDLRIVFAQPSDLSTRSTMKTLAAGGTSGIGGTGVEYPPAIYFGLANRFRLQGLRIENAWDGIIQGTSPSASGGWWMEQIEISPYNRGLSIGSNLDFSHINGWHHWSFGMTTSQHGVQEDGSTYAMKLGEGAASQAIDLQDVTILDSILSIDNAGTWAHFANLMLDGGCVLSIINCLWTHVVNLYMTTGNIATTAGVLNIANFFGYASGTPSTTPLLTNSGAAVSISLGYFHLTSGSQAALFYQTSGVMRIIGSAFFPVGSPATIPQIHAVGGVVQFIGNLIHEVAGGSAPQLQIDVDNAENIVSGNSTPTGWTFTPPGLLGNYGNFGALQTAVTSPPAAITHTLGFQPSVFASYGGGPTSEEVLGVSAAGAVHIGGTISLVADPPIIVVGGVYCDNSAHIYSNPSSGQTVNLVDNALTNLLTPSATCTTLTIVMPPNPSPNQYCRIAILAHAITTLTLSPNAGQTISNPPTTMAADTSFLYAYFGTNWTRMT